MGHDFLRIAGSIPPRSESFRAVTWQWHAMATCGYLWLAVASYGYNRPGHGKQVSNACCQLEPMVPPGPWMARQRRCSLTEGSLVWGAP